VLSRSLAILTAAAALLLPACASRKVSDSDRTATEQFLLSKAAAEAVDRLTFDLLRGRRVYVDATYFAALDAPFVMGEMRARMLLAGVQLVDTPDEAEVVAEVRSNGVGIDRTDFLLGFPSFGNVTPELALLKRTQQYGFASVAYVAYWAATGEAVANSGPFIGRTLRDDFWVFGIGPRSLGDIPTVEPEEPPAPTPRATGAVPPEAQLEEPIVPPELDPPVDPEAPPPGDAPSREPPGAAPQGGREG
jgi:uncharacterized protein DUF6655